MSNLYLDIFGEAGRGLDEFNPEAERSVREGLNQLYVGPESSFSDRFMKSFATGSSLSRRAADMAASKTAQIMGDPQAGTFTGFLLNALHGEFRWRDENTGEFRLHMLLADQLYGEDYFNQSQDEIRQDRQGRVQELGSKLYKDVQGDSLAGTLVSELADPSSVIPFGHGVKTAAAVGGVLGGTDAAFYSWAQDGKVDLVDVALGTALGTALGGVVEAVRLKLFPSIRDHALTRTKMTKESVESASEGAVTGSKAENIANSVNETLGINHRETLELAEQLGDMAPNFHVKMDPFLQEGPYMTQWMKKYRQPLKQYGDLRKLENKYSRTLSSTYDIDSVNLGPVYMAQDLDDVLSSVAKGRQIDDAWHQYHEGLDLQKHKDWMDFNKSLDEVRVNRQLSPLDELDHTNYRNSGVAYNSLDDVAKAAAREDARAFKQVLHGFGGVGKTQGGAIDPRLLQHFTSGLLGYGIGGFTNGEEGAALGAVVGVAAPSLWRKMFSSGADLADPVKRSEWLEAQFVKGKLFQKPFYVFRKFDTADNSYGTQMAESLRFAEMWSRQIASGFHTDFFNEINKLRKIHGGKYATAVADEARSILNRTAGDQVSNDAVRVAKVIEKNFDDVLKLAEQAKILTAEKAGALRAHAKKHGYFPRVYDHTFLQTPEGRKSFIEALSSKTYTKKEVADTLERLLGREPDEAKRHLTREFYTLGGRDDPTKGYLLSRRQMEWMWNKLNKENYTRNSKHLERERMLSESMEEALSPFLIKNTNDVLISYYQDISKRIAYAKVFGVKDEKARALIEAISAENQVNPDFFYQVYYTARGDSQRSRTIAEHVDMNPKLKRLFGAIRAFETTKLATAQMINVWQPLVNGTTQILAKGGSNPYAIYGRALKRLVSTMTREEAVDFGRRSGAAFESAIMQAMGELNANAHTILGKDLTGGLRYFNWINNPSEFLRVTGFAQIETFNRILSANMGREYAMDLLEKKASHFARIARLEAKGITNPKAKQITKINREIDKLDQALAELGIHSEVSLKEVADKPYWLEIAGQKFSNEVNFVNTPDQIPLAWQSPYASAFRQFKTFAFHHASFVWNNVFKPAVRDKNYKPLINYFGVMAPAIGIPTDTVRRMIRGDDDELSNTQAYVRGLGSVGGAGLWADLAHTLTAYGAGMAALSVAGPGPSDILKIGSSFGSGSITKTAKTFYETQPGLKAVDTVLTGGSIRESLEERLKMLRERNSKKSSFSGKY